MIVFLNYLPNIILALGIWLTTYLYLKDKRELFLFAGIGTIVLLVALKAITPSYMPKGTVQTVPIIQPEAKELPPMVDRTLKPEMTNEERKKNFDEKFDAVKQSK